MWFYDLISKNYQMASVTKSKHVFVDDKQVSINDFTTTDRDIYSYFANMSESEDLDKKFIQALKVGVVAAKTIDTVGNVDYVEKQFNILDSSFKQKIDEIFGEKGKFSEILNENFGEDGQLLKDYLNPHKEGSPLQLTVKEVTTRIEELKTLLGIKIGKDEAEEKSTKKGTKFEDDCEPLLEEIAKMHGDDVIRTGTKKGKVTDANKGDFVYTIKELNKKIVWEAKNYSSKLSMEEIQKNLDGGIENREADYGILVSKTLQALPRSIGWFKELSDKKLVCALGDNDQLHAEILHIAYRWARAKLLQEATKNAKFDATLVRDKINNVQKNLKKLASIKRQCGNIDKASKEISDLAETLDSEIDEELGKILDSLK